MKTGVGILVLVCAWKTCNVSGGFRSDCPRGSSGSESQMLVAEALTRKPGEIFLRECAASERELALAWEKAGSFFKGEK